MTESELQTARRELERVLASPGFARNDRLARFLRFVVEKHLEGGDDEVKESVLAVEVFGRSPDYNSKRDSIVRTEATRWLSNYRRADIFRSCGRPWTSKDHPGLRLKGRLMCEAAGGCFWPWLAW